MVLFIGRGSACRYQLTAAAAPYFLEMSLMTECRFWAEQAIAASSSEQISASREVQLQYALGISLLFTGGSADQVSTALYKALALAQLLNDMHAQLRLMSALHIFKTRGSDFVGSLEVSERCMAVAKKIGDRCPSIMVAEWLLGIANHLIGNQEEACRQCESANDFDSRTGMGKSRPPRLRSPHHCSCRARQSPLACWVP